MPSHFDSSAAVTLEEERADSVSVVTTRVEDRLTLTTLEPKHKNLPPPPMPPN